VFSGNNLTVSGESGQPAEIGVIGNSDNLSGGNVGNDTIWSIGDTVTVSDTTPGNLFGEIGNNDTVIAGPGNDTIWTIGNNESIVGGAGPSGSDLIGLEGSNSSITGEGGNDTVYVNGNNDTIAGGSGNALIEWSGSNHTLADNAAVYNDTVVGFDQAAGDTIKISGTGHTVAHTAQVNGGQDTLITLSDNSTILLKYVNSVNNSIFS
jgi:Ca2+-binding RTX toxin-like protein